MVGSRDGWKVKWVVIGFCNCGGDVEKGGWRRRRRRRRRREFFFLDWDELKGKGVNDESFGWEWWYDEWRNEIEIYFTFLLFMLDLIRRVLYYLNVLSTIMVFRERHLWKGEK